MNASRKSDPFGARIPFDLPGAGPATLYSLPHFARQTNVELERMPYSIRILLEAALRNCDGFQVTEADVLRIAGGGKSAAEAVSREIPFKPARVILQDFTGVPCVVDLAAMRDAVSRVGGDPARINPLVPVDLVIDHSVQVDVFGNVPGARAQRRDRVRAQSRALRVPALGTEGVRQLPRRAAGHRHRPPGEPRVPGARRDDGAAGGGATVAFPDTLVGTDSHTTMINGLGVVGWGVGGIEAEAVMLGQPLYMLMPEVVGFRLTGQLREGVTATDLVLTVTQMLRKKGVVDKFVEFCGPGLSPMSLADRATIGNMAPEYGATIGFFPVDAETLRYMVRTNRADDARRLEAYCKEQGLFRTDDAPEPAFTDALALDLGDVEPSLAGPKRPQDRVPLRDVKTSFRRALVAPVKERGYGLAEADTGARSSPCSSTATRERSATARW